MKAKFFEIQLELNIESQVKSHNSYVMTNGALLDWITFGTRKL